MIRCCNSPPDTAMRLSSRPTLLFPLSFCSCLSLYVSKSWERRQTEPCLVGEVCQSAYLSVCPSVSWEMCELERLSLSSHFYFSPSHLPLCLNPKYGQGMTCQLQESHLLGFHLISPLQPASHRWLLISTGGFPGVSGLTCWLQGVGKLHQVESNTF